VTSPPKPKADLLDRTFEVGITLKGLDGVLELIGGTLLLLLSPATIDRIVVGLTQHELSQDPHDFIAVHALNLAHGLTGTTVILSALYLQSHGVVKIVLVAALLKNKLRVGSRPDSGRLRALCGGLPRQGADRGGRYPAPG
jgi:uncharacterized membrane protein